MKMAGIAKWCGLSLIIHLTVIGFLIFQAKEAKQAKPITIVLSLEPYPVSTGAPSAPRPKRSAVEKPVRREPTPIPPHQALRESSPPPAVKINHHPAPTTADNPVADPVPRQSAHAGETAPSAAAPLSAQSSGEASALNPNPSSETPITTEKLKHRYLREHLAHIRDMIIRRLVYPPLARRMNWSGTVTLKFVVRNDGSADSIEVLKSSGHRLLDQTAMDTVREAAPFPKPPMSAEIILPVCFSLL